MDGYQFAAAIIESIFKFLGSLGWPAAIVIAVWLFREKLNALLPLLRMKYKDLDVSFRLDQAEKEAAQIPPPPPSPYLERTPEEKSKFEQVAEISPRAAILEARAELEDAVKTVAVKLGRLSSNMKSPSMTVAIRALRNSRVISPETSALLDDLRVVGNSAAHGVDTDFGKEDALRFRSLTDQALRQLQDA